MEIIYRQLAAGLKTFAKTNKIKRCVIGLSGGLDSAVVAALAAGAFGPGNVFGVAMPSKHTSALSNDLAAQLAGNLGINFTVRPIEGAVSLLSAELKKDFPGGLSALAAQNLQSRLRGVFLMAFANQLGGVALACANKSEIYTGYFTLYGDSVGALAPIGDLYKTEVYQLAAYINSKRAIIPAGIITRPPTAELAPNQKDSDDLPPYPVLDKIIEAYINARPPRAATEKAVFARIKGAAFKRRFLPPVIEVKK